MQWLKPNVEFNTQKRIEAKIYDDKDGKALYKWTNNSIYGKTMEKVRNRIYVRLVSNKNGLFEMDIKTKLYVTKNIWQWFNFNMSKQSYIKI